MSKEHIICDLCKKFAKIPGFKYSLEELNEFRKKFEKQKDKTNKEKEEQNLKIIKNILLDDNHPTTISYNKTFNKQIKDIIISGKNTDHYDMEILHTDETKNKCEYKHTDKSTELNKQKTPWGIGVQCSNMYVKNLDINLTDILLKNLYENVYKDLENKYELQNKLISFVEFKKDILKTGEPLSLYLKELKAHLKKIYGNRLYGKKFRKNLLEEHNSANKKTLESINEDIIENIVDKINSKLNDHFKDKEIWLNTAGKLDKNFTFKWWNNINTPIIEDIILTCNNDSGYIDVNFNLKNQAILDYKLKPTYIRFRNGINNLSLEIR